MHLSKLPSVQIAICGYFTFIDVTSLVCEVKKARSEISAMKDQINYLSQICTEPTLVTKSLITSAQSLKSNMKKIVTLKDTQGDKDESVKRKDSALSPPKMRASLTIDAESGTEITAPPNDGSVSLETNNEGNDLRGSNQATVHRDIETIDHIQHSGVNTVE